jgi:hypothetical protein
MRKKYGFKPTGGITSSVVPGDPYLTAIDGKNWHTMAIRWDANTRVAWVGDRLIEEPHDHLMGEIPIDICMPFGDYNTNGEGFFLSDPNAAVASRVESYPQAARQHRAAHGEPSCLGSRYYFKAVRRY